jgi:hypothetical protein
MTRLIPEITDPGDYAMVSSALCADPTYVEMRTTSRMALAEWKSGQLEDYCGKIRPPAQ